jgi:O-antigen/teichoic acid export membrane protein
MKKLLSHTAIYGLAPQLPKILSLAILPIITQDLTATDYGVYGIITAYSSAFSVLSLLGIRTVLLNSYYHYGRRYKFLWRQLFGFLHIWNVVFAFLLALLINWILPNEAENYRNTVILLTILPYIVFGPLPAISLTYFQLNQKPQEIAYRSVFGGVLTVLFQLLFISKFKMGFMGWIYASFLGVMLTNLSYVRIIYFKSELFPIFNFKVKTILRALKESWPMIPHFYAAFLLDSSDKIVMDYHKVDSVGIGKYNLAYSVSSPFQALVNSVSTAITPLAYEFYKKKEELEVRKLIFVSQLGISIFTFLSCVWMKELFQILIKNDELKNMYSLAIIIIMAYNYRPIYLGAILKLNYFGKNTSIWKVSLCAGIINVIINLIFIPIYGYKIAAYSTFIAFMLMAGLGYLLREFKELKTINYYQFHWILLNFILTFIVYFIVDFISIDKIIITIILIIASLISFFYLKKKSYI